MKNIIAKHKLHWSQKSFLLSIFFGILLLVGSLAINYAAGNYANKVASNGVTDIILDNVPVMDVDGIYVYGALLFGLFMIAIFIREPKQIPFAIKSAAIFYFIRAIFISLTHIGPILQQVPSVSGTLYRNLIFGSDYFFSGHTGLPFLAALVYWDNKYLRYTFIIASLIFGTSALIGHYHYSIDVFAAFFISYGIFHIAKKIFKKDYEIFVKT